MWTTNVTAAELQWRKGGPKAKHAATAADSPAKTQAVTATVHRDGAVRQVAFESDEVVGPSFGAQQAGGPALRSVVVERDATFDTDASETVRSAQLEFRPPSQADDNRYGEQIAEPFGQEQETVETESTEIELDEEITLPPAELPEEELTPPEVEIPLPEQTELQPETEMRQPPRTFQPAPPTDEPRATPFAPDDYEPEAGLPPVDDQTLADEGAKAQADCDTELEKLKAHKLHDVDLNIAIAGNPGEDFPFECTIDEGTLFAGRTWCETTYMWKASALCHKPLYFEDEALERYGHSWGPCLDPFVSGAHFFCKLPVLPYCMGVTPPNECVYALGHYRPGSCAPYLIDPIPISCRGAVFEAGAVVGAAAVLP